MSEELELLKDVCGRLEGNSIPYMITGSIASNLYALPRMTRDIDIVIEIKQGGAGRIRKIFEGDFYVDEASIQEAIATRGMFNIIHNRLIFKIDFIVRKDSPYRELEFKRRRFVEMKGTTLWVVSPEDLILSKLFWAKDSLSELQLKDVENLLRTVKPLDVNYLEKWVAALGLESVYARVKK